MASHSSSQNPWDAVAAKPVGNVADELDEVDPWQAVASKPLQNEQEVECESSGEVLVSLADMLQPARPKAQVRGRPRKRPHAADIPVDVDSGCPPLASTEVPPLTGPPTVPGHLALANVTFKIADITVDSVQQLLKRPRKGRVGLGSLECTLGRAQELAKNADPGLMDADVLSIAKMYLDHNYRMSTHTLKLSELGGMDDKMFQTKLQRLANALVLVLKHCRCTLERFVVRDLPRLCLISYVDMICYDETPMKTTIKDSASTSLQPTNAPTSATASLLRTLIRQVKGDAVIGKLLQTKPKYSLLLQIGSAYMQLCGGCYTPIQCIERNSSQIMLEALSRVSYITYDIEQFKCKTRIVCCDQAPSNLRAEQSLIEERGPTWASCVLPCAVHITSACFQKTFDLIPKFISGLLHTSLALRNGASMLQFRTCVRHQVRKRFCFVLGPLHEDAIQWKLALLKTFASNSGSATYKAVLLLMVFNGDWRNEEQVQHIPTSHKDTPDTAEFVQDLMESAIIAVACATKPGLWPRSRWTGAELPVNQYGLLSSVHGVFLPAYAQWLESHSSVALQGGMGSVAEAADGPVPLSSSAVDVSAGMDIDNIPANTLEELHPGAGSAGELLAAANSKNRSESRQWMQGRPFPMLIVVRKIQEPLRQLLQDQFYYSSQQYQIELQAAFAEAKLTHSPVRSLRFPVVIAAEQELEASFMERMHSLMFDRQAWTCLPSWSRNLDSQHLVFRLISRAAGAVHQLLTHVHSQYPFRLFQALHHPERGGEFELEPPCLKDPFALHLQQLFGFTSEEFRQTLAQHASIMEVDIASIEARHASVRRQLYTKSCQTWVLPVKLASAEWIFQNYRNNVHGVPEQFKFGKVSGSLIGAHTQLLETWFLVLFFFAAPFKEYPVPTLSSLKF